MPIIPSLVFETFSIIDYFNLLVIGLPVISKYAPVPTTPAAFAPVYFTFIVPVDVSVF